MLYFTDDVDEFAVRMLMNYKEKEFKSVSSGDLGLDIKEDEKPSESDEKDNKELFELMKQSLLSDKVKDVRASKRLKNHPVCLSSDGELTIEMEKILNSMPNNDSGNIKADKVLEINTHHDVFKALKEAYENDKDKLSLYTDVLYNQALLIEGLPIKDPVEFTNNICKIMV
ncbi:MAG: hypothetical protein VR72_12625 [Clostridiaceae bacterium BRH_c20a]|nr:MAG: hypothetical protein VR72_12625 [Clostridiaceae bacterium BRH_c20a]